MSPQILMALEFMSYGILDIKGVHTDTKVYRPIFEGRARPSTPSYATLLSC